MPEVIYLTQHPHRDDPSGGPGVRIETFRGPGPGGQHRNKTSSGVRAVHEPTGIAGLANDSRDQSKNRLIAVARLRHAMTVRCRKRVFLDRLETPAAFDLDAGPKSAGYLPTLGHALDVLLAAGWVVSVAADKLGTTTGQLSRLLTDDEDTLAHVNRERAEVGLKPLRPR